MHTILTPKKVLVEKNQMVGWSKSGFALSAQCGLQKRIRFQEESGTKHNG
jgi:hypothetical protein